VKPKQIKFNYQEGIEYFSNLMLSTNPVWVGRNGDSDTDFVEKWKGEDVKCPLVENMKRLNGYYDKDNLLDNLHKFRDMYLKSSANTDLTTVHMSSIFGKSLEGDEKCLKKLSEDYGISTIMCWRFIENCTYFLEAFQRWGEGKKILVISPFSKSIQFQTQPERIHNLHKDPYKFPKCQILTYNSPITYNTDNWLCTDIADHRNWFDTAQAIFQDISEIDFDVAWLACGSYAMFLGEKIKTNLKKKAIYVGGMSNVFFNIYNFRYSSTGHDQCVINTDFQIESFENQQFFQQDQLKHFPFSEGLNAYFGGKPQ